MTINFVSKKYLIKFMGRVEPLYINFFFNEKNTFLYGFKQICGQYVWKFEKNMDHIEGHTVKN